MGKCLSALIRGLRNDGADTPHLAHLPSVQDLNGKKLPPSSPTGTLSVSVSVSVSVSLSLSLFLSLSLRRYKISMRLSLLFTILRIFSLFKNGSFPQILSQKLKKFLFVSAEDDIAREKQL